jgi:hypothetical protein
MKINYVPIDYLMPTRHDLQTPTPLKKPLPKDYLIAREIREGVVRPDVALIVQRTARRATKPSKDHPKPSEPLDCKENATK